MSATEIAETMDKNEWHTLSDADKMDALYIAVNDVREKLNSILVIVGDMKEMAGPMLETIREPGGLMKLIAGGL